MAVPSYIPELVAIKGLPGDPGGQPGLRPCLRAACEAGAEGQRNGAQECGESGSSELVFGLVAQHSYHKDEMRKDGKQIVMLYVTPITTTIIIRTTASTSRESLFFLLKIFF